jgi:ATP-binding cassette subfamily C protein
MNNLYQYLFRYKGLSLARIVTNSSKAVGSVLISILLGNILDGLAASDECYLMNAIIRCIAVVGIFIIISGLDIIITAIHTKKLLSYMKQEIFSKIVNGTLEEYQIAHSGKYISILNNDISVINEDFIGNFYEAIFQILSFIFSVCVMIFINPIVTFIIILISLISICTVSYISDKLMKQQIKLSQSLENITKLVSEFFSGIFVIKNYNIVNKIEEIYSQNDMIVEENRKRYSIIVGFINVIMFFFSMLSYLTIILFCMHSVLAGSLSVGSALIVIQLGNNLTEPINEIISLVSTMYSVKGIAEKIEKIKNYATNNEELKEIKEKYTKCISIKDVSFGYIDEPVIKNINIELNKGKKYALVGESGSGKSTIIKLLLKYYGNYSGQITIDGKDIQKIKMESYCNLVSTMEQNTFIFDDSFKNNICLFQNYSEKEIEKVIEKAGLKQVVEKLPNGLETVLGENGCKLSGGECKRIAFARLLLKKTPILLLDEATSNLDNNSTMMLESIILNDENLTVVSVTHKLIKCILERYDQIIVLKNGRIIEGGTFNNLIGRKGYFYNLYNTQKIFE